MTYHLTLSENQTINKPSLREIVIKALCLIGEGLLGLAFIAMLYAATAMTCVGIHGVNACLQ